MLGSFSSIIHFFVWIFIRDYVLRYGNAYDYYSLCGSMIPSLLNWCVRLCSRARALFVFVWEPYSSWGLNRHKRYVYECVRESVCACIFLKLEKSWLSISDREAECVLRLSMEHLRDRIIAVSSASVPVWETQCIIIQLFPVSRENIYINWSLVTCFLNYNNSSLNR